MKKIIIGLILSSSVLALGGCCTERGTLVWTGACIAIPPTPESIEAARLEDKYQAYERAHERKVVQGLGGAMYHRDAY